MLIGWSLGCDKNGDLEAVTNKLLRKQVKSLKKRMKRLLEEEARIYTKLEGLNIIDYLGANSNAAANNKNTNANTNDTTNNSTVKTMFSITDDNDSNETKNTHKLVHGRDSEIAVSYVTEMHKQASVVSDAENDNNEAIGSDNEENDSQPNKEAMKRLEKSHEEIEEKCNEAIENYRGVIVGDFFVSTCWRLHLASATLLMALIAAYETDVCVFVLVVVYVYIHVLIFVYLLPYLY